jgi:hypothetical protein
MNKNKQHKQESASDSGHAEESSQVVRYVGASMINIMMENEQYAGSFTNIQLGIEYLLLNRIIEVFQGEKKIKVRESIEAYCRKKEKFFAQTAELIKWAYVLGAIDKNEYSDLKDFNKKRNIFIHGHGEWYNKEEYKEALIKGIRFLKDNGLE